MSERSRKFTPLWHALRPAREYARSHTRAHACSHACTHARAYARTCLRTPDLLAREGKRRATAPTHVARCTQPPACTRPRSPWH
eukprot:4968736-Pleurochrysis_carterae.AAC.1